MQFRFSGDLNLIKKLTTVIIGGMALTLSGCGGGAGSGGSGTAPSSVAPSPETVLASLSSYPYGSLIQASDGYLYGMTSLGGTWGWGTVFKMNTAGGQATLYSFQGNSVSGGIDGGAPYGSLIQASDGNFYGMTSTGGISGWGGVFKVTAAGAETPLYFFAGGTADGATPYGSLIQATDGNLYGMTSTRGGNGNGMVFKITLGGTETMLYSFAGGTDGANPQGSLIQASDGNLYGMTKGNGTNSLGTVFKITTTGGETVLYSFTGGTTDGATPYGSLIQASDGNLYGMTSGGGANNLGTVFKITTTGVETVLYSFTGGADGLSPHGSLIQASDGHFYGVTLYGGSGNGGIAFKIQ